MSSAVRVVVVEDDLRYRQSLETLFGHTEPFVLAGSFGSAAPALERAGLVLEGRAEPWDLVVMDLDLPRMPGIEATRRLKAILPQVPVVVLTVFEEPATILEAICAGADGYLLKRTPAHELATQLRLIAGGGAPLTAGVARKVLELVRAATPRAHRVTEDRATERLDLTAREQEVLRALSQGRAYKQIGHDLGISIDTVRTHIRAVYRKLQAHSVAEAVSRAIRERLI